MANIIDEQLEQKANEILGPFFGAESGIYTEERLIEQDKEHYRILRRSGFTGELRPVTIDPDPEYQSACHGAVIRAAERAGFAWRDIDILRKHLLEMTEAEIGKLYGITQQAVNLRLAAIRTALTNPEAWVEPSTDPYADIWQVLSQVFHLSYDTIRLYCLGTLEAKRGRGRPRKRN